MPPEHRTGCWMSGVTSTLSHHFYLARSPLRRHLLPLLPVPLLLYLHSYIDYAESMRYYDDTFGSIFSGC